MIQEDPFPRLDFREQDVVVPAPEDRQKTMLHVPGEGKYMVDGLKMSVFEEIPLKPPFSILFTTDDSGAWKYGISKESYVFDGITSTTCPVTALLEDPDNINDPGWKNPAVGFVFLWGTVKSDGSIENIVIKNDQTSLENIYRTYAYDGKQTKFAWVIGYLWSEGSGDSLQWYVRQECNRNVSLLYVVVNGVLCKVPFEM
jgi:hypothetical protein